VVSAPSALEETLLVNLQLFALEPAHELGRKVSSRLAIPLSPHEEREFEDGEHKCRPLASVRGADVFVIESLYSDPRRSVNDKLARLLFFLGALRDASASRITAVVPYLAYARKDRKTKPRDPVTTRYVASLFEAVGIDGILVMDVHNLSAYQNAFRCRTEHLEARPLFADHFASPPFREEEVLVLSPDAGGMKRAEIFRRHLERLLGKDVRSGFMEKQRSSGVVSGEALVGDVSGSTVIVIDDLVSTGTTLLRAARACRRHGARRVVAAATHGLFVGDANRLLAEPELDQIVVTDTVPPFRLDPELAKRKVRVLDTAELFSEAISRIHGGGSLIALLGD
jgi:ribose-phosphate pyrophosphokinase